MACNKEKLLKSIYHRITVPSFYPYFCHASNDNDRLEIMLKFLNDCDTQDDDPWMWFIETPVEASSDPDSVVNDWVVYWNELAVIKKHKDDNNGYQTVIHRNKYGSGYSLEIRATPGDETAYEFRLNEAQCSSVLRLMLTTRVYDVGYIFMN